MESLQYERQIEDRGARPLRFATPYDFACVLILAVHGTFLLSQGFAIASFASTAQLKSLLTLAAIPELLALGAQVGLVALAVGRLCRMPRWRWTMAAFITIVVMAKVRTSYQLFSMGGFHWISVLYTGLDLATGLVESAMIAIGVLGKGREATWKVLRRRWWICGLMALWIVLLALSTSYHLYLQKLRDYEGLPARVYVQPVLGMVMFFVSACVVAAAVWRSRCNLQTSVPLKMWVGIAVLMVGVFVETWVGIGGTGGLEWLTGAVLKVASTTAVLLAASLLLRQWESVADEVT